MPGEDGQADARRHVPLAHRLVDAAADDEDLLDDDARDVAVVPGQDADAVAPRRLGRPQPDRVVVGSGRKDRPVLIRSRVSTRPDPVARIDPSSLTAMQLIAAA